MGGGKCHADISQKNARVAILILAKVDLKSNNITKDTKGSFYQRDIWS